MNRLNGSSWRNTFAVAAVALSAAAAAASFGVSRIAVTFDDRKPVTVVERDGKLKVQAEVSVSGSGLLVGAWEVAGPNTDGNRPNYRVLGQVHQPVSGVEIAEIAGPALPTYSTGQYLVRLRVVEPALAFETPVVRYSVIEKKK